MATIDYEFEGSNRQLDVNAGDVTKPMVVLLHGTNGEKRDMTNPAYYGFNYDFTGSFPPGRNIGWRAYPGVGIWSFKLDELKDVTSWQDVLNQNNFGTVVYSQLDAGGLLARPVRELATVMTVLQKHFPDNSFVLLAHSRGGLLVRKFLKDFPDLATRIVKVITLHAPHTGSELANASQAVNGAINDLRGVFGNISAIDDALRMVTSSINTPAFQEFTVGSAFLTDLENGEVALANIEYYSFGGTNVTFTRLLAWVYNAASAIPQWNWPPFFHRIITIELPVISPVLDSLPNLTPEITSGQGDILTADARTRIPFGIHNTKHISHAEALWDPGLQAHVLSILGATPGFWS